MPDLRNIFRVPDAVRIITERNAIALLNETNVTSRNEGFNIDNTDNSDQELSYRSILGTPIYANIEFLPGTYETNTKGIFRSFGSSVDGPNRLRYEQVLLTINQSKLIVKTQIQGRNGSVKEYIGMDDFDITVNGILTGLNGQRPIDQITALNKMLIAPIPIEVSSVLLQAIGINYLVVNNYQIEEAEGGYSYQKFSISFMSDEQQELELTNL